MMFQSFVPLYFSDFTPYQSYLCYRKACSVIDVKNRYNNMYIPSDFYHLSLDWSTAFPLHRRFNLGNATKYTICHKDMHPVQPHPENVDPSDADYSYSAKVSRYIAAQLSKYG